MPTRTSRAIRKKLARNRHEAIKDLQENERLANRLTKELSKVRKRLHKM